MAQLSPPNLKYVPPTIVLNERQRIAFTIFNKILKSVCILYLLLFELESVMYDILRLAKYQAFKSFNKCILVATDMFESGIDIARVDIVIIYDIPASSNAYLDRVSDA